MNRIKVIGLAFIAVLAVSGISAATATTAAADPCLITEAMEEGNFTKRNCSGTAAALGEFVLARAYTYLTGTIDLYCVEALPGQFLLKWNSLACATAATPVDTGGWAKTRIRDLPAGSGTFPMNSTSTSGASAWKIEGGSEVVCEKNEGNDEIVNETSTLAAFTFKGCSGKIAGKTCSTEFKTKELTGTIGGTVEAETGVGLLLKPKSGEVFAEFECEGKLPMKGSVAAEVTPVNEFSTLSSLVFAVSGGEQRIKHMTVPVTGGESVEPKLTVEGKKVALESTVLVTYKSELEVTN